MNIEYRKTDGEDPEFVRLCGELEICLDEMVGKVIQRDKYHKYNLRDNIHDVYLAYVDGEAVGCGSYKRYDAENAELKRVFLRKEYRGQGIAKKLLSLIERDAKNAGYRYMILETGELLKESVGLYRHTGYETIPNYGQYADMPESLCMRKVLKDEDKN